MGTCGTSRPHEHDDINDAATARFGAVPHRWRHRNVAFHLLRDKRGRDALVRYYERYIAIAQADGVGFILESPTWRASSDWGSKLGYSLYAIAAVNRQSIELMHELKAR